VTVRRLDILYVGMLPPHPGGSAISWFQVLGGFTRRGHAVRAVAPITEAALRGGDEFATSHPEIEVTRFLVPHFYTGPNVPASEAYRSLERRQIEAALGRLIAERRPDVIVVGRETFALHVPDVARRHGVPCLLGIRGNTTIAILNGTYPEAMAQELLAEYRKADLLVSVAEHMARGLAGLGFANVTVIPNAVDLERFAPRPKDATLLRALAVPDGHVVVLHASNLKGVKRPLDLVASAAQAARETPRLVYVIVGDGTYRGAMEEACRELGVAGQFRFTGWMDYVRIPDLINLADVVVMPSESEGLSRVYLEAQACGRLLLASDIAPAREVITDGETGLLFRMGDIADLTAKTLLAAGDPRLRAAIGRRARERVRAHALDDVVAAYEGTMEACRRGDLAGALGP